MEDLLGWYDRNKRTLPWREDRYFYGVWISEIMLQQTRVNQMMEYYDKFMQAFPSLESLAKASEDEVLKNWQGLGYYSRARNIYFTARQLVFEMNSEVPESFCELKKLKGIGDYTAAAIASICFGEAVTAVDGNVLRVFSRLFNKSQDIAQIKTRNDFFKLGNQIIDAERPGDFNQALMELGATICLPKQPLCTQCPIAMRCLALKNHTVEKLPYKSSKIKIKQRFLNYFLVNDEWLFQQRRDNDIWKNLYEMPLLETEKPLDRLRELEGFRIDQVCLISEQLHVLTHQKLHIKFWAIHMQEQDYLLFKQSKIASVYLEQLPLPKPIEKFIDQYSV